MRITCITSVRVEDLDYIFIYNFMIVIKKTNYQRIFGNEKADRLTKTETKIDPELDCRCPLCYR